VLDREYKVCLGSRNGEVDKQLLPIFASVRRKVHFGVSQHSLAAALSQ